MNTIYSISDGTIVELYQAEGYDVGSPTPPEHTYQLSYDPVPQDWADDIIVNTENYSLVAQDLTVGGVSVVVNPTRDEIIEGMVEQGSYLEAQNVPGWASWNKVSANEWFSTNVESLLSEIPNVDGLTPTQFQNNAQAIIAQMQDIITNQATVIEALGQMVIALRNETWPNLQE